MVSARRKRHTVSYDDSTELSQVENSSKRRRVIIDDDGDDDIDEEMEIEDFLDDSSDNDESYKSQTKSKSRSKSSLKSSSNSKSKTSKRSNKSSSNRLNNKSTTIASNIDEIDDYKENPIFQSLSNGDLTSSQLAQSWFDDFITNDLNIKFDALKDLLNFILRSAGCIVQLSRHDVTNSETAKETVSEIQTSFARQKYHEFPMLYAPVNKGKKTNIDWKEFPINALSFISSIILIASESGILYEEDNELIELLLEWIGSMSTSNIRALRYVSTIFGLNIQSVLCKLSVNISKFIDKFLRQLKKENDSLQLLIDNSKKKKVSLQTKRQIDAIDDRIKLINNNVEMYKKQKKIVDNYINDFFNTLFAHRYRDVASEIRIKCVTYLGEWMDDYPEMFSESFYLRYLGWLLTDQDSNIRAEVFKVLIKIYKKRVTVSSLSQFTSYFKNKLIEIVIYETDFGTRLNCLQLLNEIIDKGYLNDDDIIQITSLIFIDNEDIIYPFQGSKLNPGKLLKEISKFLTKVETNMTTEFLEQKSIELEKINEVLSFDSKDFIKFKFLLQILSDSYEYYNSTYCKDKIKYNIENCKIKKFTKIFQSIYSLKRYNENNESFELILNYINFDFSAISKDIITEDLRESLELDSNYQYFLLNLINASSKIYCEGSNNEYHKTLFPYIKGSKNVINLKDSTYYVSKLLIELFKITNYFHYDIDKISVLIEITCNILNNMSSLNMNELNIKGLKDTIEQFYRFFPVINFPLTPQKINFNSDYFNSITYQYIQLFQKVNNIELDLNGPIDLLFSETSMSLDTKIEENDSKIIESINRLYILQFSISTQLVSRIYKKLSTILNNYSKSLYFQISKDSTYINEADSYNISTPISQSELFSFLQISTTYITNSLYNFYTNKSKNELSDLISVKNTISCINTIQQSLSLLIDTQLLNSLTIDQLHIICTSFIENAFTISAFKAEYSSLTNNQQLEDEFDETMMTLRSYILPTIQTNIIKLYCIREFQYAELINIENKLEREADEDVNFTKYSVSNDEDIDEEDKGKKIRLYETYLCEIASKLVLSCKLNLIIDSKDADKITNRIQLNSKWLKNKNTGNNENKNIGEMYSRVMAGVGILTALDDVNNENGKTKQSKITNVKISKKRKLIDEESEDDSEHGEDENDPIENSDDEQDERDNENEDENEDEDDEIEDEEEVVEKERGSSEELRDENDENMEFSDIDDDSVLLPQYKNKRTNTTSSEISSLASSFPFTQ
ncbi:Irr1 protein [Pichia kluyveri]|uniref:Irr1 protein n=1 Tax=Pichia kluyveri TaxID=36015 RepID=A0AAV5QYQ0_PICKL|nr:Irr1 protein [Pichia kluyveri]